MKDWCDEMPAALRVPEALIVRGIATRMIECIVHARSLRFNSDVARTLASLAIAEPTCECLKHRWRSCLDILQDASDDVDLPCDHSGLDMRVRLALQAIGERYSDPLLTVAQIARESRVSLWHLSRLMRRELNTTVRQMIHRARMKAAERQLSESALSIKEIAAVVGYQSATELGRQFKATHGMNPTAYRTRVRSKKLSIIMSVSIPRKPSVEPLREHFGRRVNA